MAQHTSSCHRALRTVFLRLLLLIAAHREGKAVSEATRASASKTFHPRFHLLSISFCLLFSTASFAFSAGELDASFNPGTGAWNSTAYTSAVQADGKIIIGGNFGTVNGVARNCIARLNVDGSLDSSFNPGSGANSSLRTIAVQADGKIVMGGFFTTVNGVESNYLARLNDNGSVDVSFPGTGVNSYVYSSAVQADGKILIGGNFTSVSGGTRSYIARLNADGSFDSSFSSLSATGANGHVYTIALQADGKILIGGNFTSVGGGVRNRIARLNTNSLLDTSFNPGAGANSWVYASALQADGKIIIGGAFTAVNGVARNYIARLNADGSVDGSFNPGTGTTGYVQTVVVQADGKIVMGGGFTSVNGIARNYIARLNADGSVDSSFNPGTAASAVVYTSLVQSDGKIVMGGAYSTPDMMPRNYIARIHSGDSDADGIEDAADQFPNDSDNDGVVNINDAFPLNAAESLDTDLDGTGNNADPDDDNDGLPDVMDPLPLQAKFNRDATYQGSQVRDSHEVQ